MQYENYSIMVANLKKGSFTVDKNDIFKGTEYAGTWKYKYPPNLGKETITPVEVDLIRKYQ